MPFEPGNQAAKGRTNPHEFSNALRLTVKEARGDKTRLHSIAEQLVQKAEGGDVAAIKEVADRLDGRPAQALTGDGGGPLELIHRIERIIVEAPDRDG